MSDVTLPEIGRTVNIVDTIRERVFQGTITHVTDNSFWVKTPRGEIPFNLFGYSTDNSKFRAFPAS